MIDEIDEIRATISDLSKQKFIVAITLGTILLIAIDSVFSQDGWKFAILLVFAWPLEEIAFKFIRELFSAESASPFRFFFYILAVFVAGLRAIVLGQQFLSPFHLPSLGNTTSARTQNVTTTMFNETFTWSTTMTSQNSLSFHAISNFWTVLGVSALTSVVCELLRTKRRISLVIAKRFLH